DPGVTPAGSVTSGGPGAIRSGPSRHVRGRLGTMATRTSSPARASKGSSRTSSARSARGSGGGSHDPSTLPLPVRAVRSGYLAIARGVGGFVRAIGVARWEVEHEQRRDGYALFLLLLAALIAVREWWQLPGAVFGAVHVVAAGTFGIASVALPL